jgi:rSAM/selenodomain-associated transferase 1
MRWLGLMAKYWRPGAVKTRLAASVGPKVAADLQRAFLATLTRRLAGSADERELVISPAASARDFESLAGAPWRVAPQADGDLGNRLRSCFDAAFSAGATRVVVIGADCPLLGPDAISHAFELLDEAQVVLGPAEDGGYYLVGARDRTPPIFTNIPWSTAAVWNATVAALDNASIAYRAIRPSYDVDELADLVRLRDDLAAISPDQDLLELRAAVARALA